jgi:hypothetical protein
MSNFALSVYPGPALGWANTVRYREEFLLGQSLVWYKRETNRREREWTIKSTGSRTEEYRKFPGKVSCGFQRWKTAFHERKQLQQYALSLISTLPCDLLRAQVYLSYPREGEKGVVEATVLRVLIVRFFQVLQVFEKNN